MMNLTAQIIFLTTFFLVNIPASVIKSDVSNYDFSKSVIKRWRKDSSRSPSEASEHQVREITNCDSILNPDVITNIRSYQNDVDTIIEKFVFGDFKGKTFDFLAELTDTFGSRMTGSVALDDAISWMLNQGDFYGYNVYTEPVTAPQWVRNNESLLMTSPRVQNIPFLGLGLSVGTPPEGITANILVVTSFGDLDSKATLAFVRIVVYNVPFTEYRDTLQYRLHGADEASKYGAVASLVRSVTPFSIASSHTGYQMYSGDVPKIPAAAITIEDAEMLNRIQLKGETITLHLTMGAEILEGVDTRNTILEISGTIAPEEVTIFSGHLDSWDGRVGAMDDGGDVVIGFMAGRALMDLRFTPRRTFRTILFTAEEQGYFGGKAYFLAHATEAQHFQIMMESDLGIFNPLGIAFSGNDEATCMMQEIAALTGSINSTQIISPAETPDLQVWAALNVPRVIERWRKDSSGCPGKSRQLQVREVPNCNSILSPEVITNIRSYQNDVDTIIEKFVSGDFKGKTFDFLAELTDTFGSRLTGSVALDNAIDWILNRGEFFGYNVHTEPVTAPHWVRNNESLFMMSPRVQNFPLLGLGNTVGTPPEGITANTLVVTSFDDLDSKASLAVGKIVVFNVPFTTYEETVEYRGRGADAASKYGAVACLVRSITPFSIASPHTGDQTYSGDVPKIPTAAITIEDAQMLYRIQQRGQLVTLHLTMGAESLDDVDTRNTILEIPGTITPEEVVVVSGHLDSWDGGVGAMDDGGGVAIGFMAGRAIIDLGFTSRRTFRTILFTSEEQGYYGGNAYFLAHAREAQNFQIMMESDFGIFNPIGIEFTGNDEAACMMQEIAALTAALNTTQVFSPADTPDLGIWESLNVPRGSLNTESDRYFWFHHSPGDRMEVLDSDSVDKVAALWTSVSYVLSDMEARLPH